MSKNRWDEEEAGGRNILGRGVPWARAEVHRAHESLGELQVAYYIRIILEDVVVDATEYICRIQTMNSLLARAWTYLEGVWEQLSVPWK